MGLYNIDFRKLTESLLPFSLRQALAELAHLFALPVRLLYTNFKDFRREKLTDLSYNSQYPNMQRLLNDRFDKTDGGARNRRIRVYENPAIINPTVAYNSGEFGKQQLVTPFVIYSYKDWGYKPFIVELPADFNADENKKNQIKRTVDIYKFAGTNYQLRIRNLK